MPKDSPGRSRKAVRFYYEDYPEAPVWLDEEGYPVVQEMVDEEGNILGDKKPKGEESS